MPQQTTGRGFPEPCPTPTQPRRPEPAPTARQRDESSPQVHPSLLRARSREGESPTQTHSAERAPVRDQPPAWRSPAPASPPAGPRPPGWVAATPQYLWRSPARPRSARPNPNPCWGMPAESPRPPARLGGARGLRPGAGRPAHSVRAAAAGVERLGSARWPRPEGSSAKARTRARLPAPAGRCLLARRVQGGGWGAPGESGEEGGEARGGGEGAAGAPWLQTRVKYPGGGVTPPPGAQCRVPGAGACGTAMRSCGLARPRPLSRG